MPNFSTESKSQSKLKLDPTKAAPDVRLGGLIPSHEMSPGTYTAICEKAWLVRISNGTRAVFQFCITDSEYTGTALRMWIDIADESGHVSPIGRFARYCEIALDRPLTRADDIKNPGAIFSGRIFQVKVGYRKTVKPRGGAFSEKNALMKKDGADYLRIHEIVARGEL